MGYAVYRVPSLERWGGYGVPARCDWPGCNEIIDRGLGYLCGSDPHEDAVGCRRVFCSTHMNYAHVPLTRLIEDDDERAEYIEGASFEGYEIVLDEDDNGDEVLGVTAHVCGRCANGEDPVDPKPDLAQWLHHITTDDSWAEWRTAYPDQAAAAAEAVKGRPQCRTCDAAGTVRNEQWHVGSDDPMSVPCPDCAGEGLLPRAA